MVLKEALDAGAVSRDLSLQLAELQMNRGEFAAAIRTLENGLERFSSDLQIATMLGIYLVENGVLPAREHAKVNLERLAEDGITLLADEFSLRERGIARVRVRSGVQPAPISTVIDAMAKGAKTIWH